jgi:hypothetical protein
MHHVHRYDIEEDPDGFDIVYTTEPSGKQIRMNIPRSGVLEDPEQEISHEQVDYVARKVGETLRHNLVTQIAQAD